MSRTLIFRDMIHRCAGLAKITITNPAKADHPSRLYRNTAATGTSTTPDKIKYMPLIVFCTVRGAARKMVISFRSAYLFRIKG
jgi:hypothetical protein